MGIMVLKFPWEGRLVAVKFVRKSFREDAKGTHGGFDRTPWYRSMNPKQRLLVIYLGVGMFAAILFIFHNLDVMKPVHWEDPREGEAVILEKAVRAEGTPQERHYLTVAVAIPAGGGEEQEPAEDLHLVDRLAVDKAGWELAEEGRSIRVTYVTNDRRSRVRVLAISIDAEIHPLGEGDESGETYPPPEPAVQPPEGQTSPGASPEPDTPVKEHPPAP